MLVTTTSRRARHGLTLIELLIALVLMGIVGAAVMTTLVKQQQFYRAAGDLMQTRSQIRQATAALPADLRGIAAASGDIQAMTASSIDFDATVGTATVCGLGVLAGGVQDLYLFPGQARGGRFTGWASAPQAGDRVSMYNPTTGSFTAPVPLVTHGSGQVVAAAAAAAAPNACTGSPFLNVAENALARPWVRLTAATLPAVPARGTVMRILRRVRYSLTQAADDQQWYLGYEELTPAGAANGPLRVLSGPYRALAADTTSGMSFAYFDANGNALALAARTQVARIDVVVRGLTAGGTPGNGSKRADGRIADDDRIVVGLRN
jgi:prepilin-type N-terminal cleavage/methylation domain-containing protein